ncbi:hypothetical protein [Desulfobotulus sp.]|uniref:hypothetical protein n=1 Tax=Desulfobotulus sp. TaxID=1940337 RepID=UPI002A36DCFE|nr:hypothetical protein [Desulfobotulus sp.]MDY0164642.1 hypothetical protein [Desulfobotulus sp.]
MSEDIQYPEEIRESTMARLTAQMLVEMDRRAAGGGGLGRRAVDEEGFKAALVVSLKALPHERWDRVKVSGKVYVMAQLWRFRGPLEPVVDYCMRVMSVGR